MPGKSKWTVLTYIAAHNNLANLGKRSLLEILNVGSTSDVVHGVLYDGMLAGLHAGAAARYLMGDPGRVEHQAQLGSFDSGDPDELIATAKWLFEQCPAERYGLVLWSHGTGWEPAEIEDVTKEARPGAQSDPAESKERASAPGSRALFRSTLRAILKPNKPAERAILFDDGTGHSLDTLELARVAGAIADSIEQPLELLGMDACLMANLEVAYEVRKAVRYLVASEELVPGHSWPYQQIFGALRANPDQGGAEFAQLIVNRYVSFYTANPPAAGDVTKVAIDLGRIEGLVHATDRLADALRVDMRKVGDLLWQAQYAAQQHETQAGNRKPSKFDYHLWDIGSIAASLTGSDAVSTLVKQTAVNTVEALALSAGSLLAYGHRGAWFDGTGGVSVYLMPPGQQRISPSYSKLAFAKDTQWEEMLEAYHATLG
jgi:hypothetical protein